MVYFDLLPPLRVLSYEDKGRLIEAMLEYGQSGVVPEFDGMLALAWGFVKPKIDKDADEYNRTVLKRQFATFCRDRKKKGEQEISFEEWMMTIDDQSNHMISHDTTWYPTTTATAATTPATSTTTSTNTATAAAANTPTNGDTAAAAKNRILKVMDGKLGQGVVFLSEQQIEELLDVIGLDAFDKYVDKLARFIIKNDANVADHYGTILKWWRQDCGFISRD